MLGAKGFLTFWPRYLTYSKKRTLLHLWNAASVFLLFSYILFSNHNFTSFLPHPLFWHTHTARFRWSVPSLPLLSFELSQSHKAGRTWTCILCLILYEKFAVRSTNMKHFSAQVLPVKLPPYFQPHFLWILMCIKCCSTLTCFISSVEMLFSCLSLLSKAQDFLQRPWFIIHPWLHTSHIVCLRSALINVSAAFCTSLFFLWMSVLCSVYTILHIFDFCL